MDVLKKILFVDDSDKDVELTLAALDEHNLANEVMVLHDGAAALAYLRKTDEFAGRPNGNPMLMLLDIKMPKVDGIEVLREVKSDPNLKTIPVVMLTSSREEQDLIRSYDLGANAYVVKPVDFTKFIDVVKQVGHFWAVINEPPNVK